jgi:hypothetical protein
MPADGLFTINNIAFYPDADLALGMSSEDDWKRQGQCESSGSARAPGNSQ